MRGGVAMDGSRGQARLKWGPNILEFETEDEAKAFARELGAEAVTYQRRWWAAVLS